MKPTLHYLFDPLCGWCYGASAALAAAANADTVQLRLLPSGLFQGAGARPMDDAFAAHAWSNDQRIERLTGQPFSQSYRDEVLADRAQRLDSGPATLALTAVALTAPEREVQALHAIQQARYVGGRDVTRLDVLADTLGALGLADAAQRLLAADLAVKAAADERIAQARRLMQHHGARGVPTFIREAGGQQRLLDGSSAYVDPDAFVAQVAAA